MGPRARARSSRARPSAAGGGKYFWAPSHAVTQSSQSDRQTLDGAGLLLWPVACGGVRSVEGRFRKAAKGEPEICEWCRTHTRTGWEGGTCYICHLGEDGLKSGGTAGKKSETTAQKIRPVFTIARGRDRSEPAR